MKLDTDKPYSTYMSICSEANGRPISIVDFYKLWRHSIDIVYNMHKKEGKSSRPYVMVEIDTNAHLYVSIEKEKIVTNVWTVEQSEFMRRGL